MSDYLCSELILEIFKRLPTKSLLRFRSVSKSLCFSISSPEFIRAHTLLTPPKVLIRHRLDGSDLLDNHYILTFDFSTDNFAMIELPEPNWQGHRLTVINGSLAVTSRGNDFTRFWVRKEDNNTAIWSEAVYNLETGVLSNLLLVNDESPKVDMEKYIETLELLGKGKIYE
nr:hypothetical protein [Tanacetum cinerariifolium]